MRRKLRRWAGQHRRAAMAVRLAAAFVVELAIFSLFDGITLPVVGLALVVAAVIVGINQLRRTQERHIF